MEEIEKEWQEVKVGKEVENIEELVRSTGAIVEMHGEHCASWRANHPNCYGCRSEFGCTKVTMLSGIEAKTLIYKEDFQAEKQKILASSSLEELKPVWESIQDKIIRKKRQEY